MNTYKNSIPLYELRNTVFILTILKKELFKSVGILLQDSSEQ